MHTYDLRTGYVLADGDLPAMPFDVRWEPSGSRIACTLPDAHTVHVVDPLTMRRIHEIPSGEDIYALSWSPDGRYLAIGRGFDVAVSDLESLDRYPLILQGHRWMVHAIEFHPSGNFLVSHSLREGISKLWDLRTRRELLTVPGYARQFDRSGTQLAFCHQASLSLKKFHGDEEYRTLAPSVGPDLDTWRVTFHPRHPLVFESGRGGIRCWNLPRQKLLAESWEEPIRTLCIDPKSGDLLTAGTAGLQRRSITLSDNDAELHLGPAEPIGWPQDAFLLPDRPAISLYCSAEGRRQVAVFQDEPFLYLYDEALARIRRLPCHPQTTFLSLSPDGRWIATGNQDAPGFTL